jgi:DNA polymerase-3 subunit delta'
MAHGMGNLLLKTLEEPPEDCLLVLATSEPQRLLPTILSRCQRIRFGPLSSDWMEPRLQQLYDRPPAQVRLAAAVSQGSMLAATRSLEGDLDAARDFVFGVFEGAIEGQTLDLLETAQHLAQEHTKKRHLVPLTLQMLATTARDAVLASQGVGAKTAAGAAAGPRLVNSDRRPAVEGIAAAFSVEALHGIVRRAETAERQIAGNAFVEHTLAALFVDIAALVAQPERTAGQKGRRR